MKNLYKNHLDKVLGLFDEVLEKYSYDEVVLYSGEAKTIYLDDNKYPFKVYTNFKYFAPVLNYPNSLIIYKSASKPKLIVLQKVDFWDSQPKPLEGDFCEFFDISYYNNIDDIKKVLPSNLKNTAFLGEEIERFNNLSFKSFNDQKIIDFIHYHRTFKSEYEIECMRRANKIASCGHIAAQKAFLSGCSELETHFEYLKAIKHTEKQVPYENIVAFDDAAAVLHYNSYKTESFEAKSFLIDAGASYNGYHADITRTFAKEQHSEYHELIKAVNDSTLNIISKIKIGMNYEVLQEEMHLDAAKIIEDFSFMNIGADEAYEKEYTKLFCPAGVGHYIGLQVHDIGNTIKDENGTLHEKSKKHQYLRLNKTIESGNVFTIEPGFYIIDQLLKPYFGKKEFNWDVINKFRSFGGPRVEDSIYVSKDGIENLTRPYLP